MMAVIIIFLISSGNMQFRIRGFHPDQWPGYRDCLPAEKIVFVYDNKHYREASQEIQILEGILLQCKIRKKLQSKTEQIRNFTILSLGSVVDTFQSNFKNLDDVRLSVGEDTYVISMVSSDLAVILDADFNFVPQMFQHSLLILRHVLCLEYRDILYKYTIGYENVHDVDENYKNYINQFQASLNEFNFERERDLLNHALRNIHSPQSDLISLK